MRAGTHPTPYDIDNQQPQGPSLYFLEIQRSKLAKR